MRPEERVALRRRFDFCCGYWGVSETDVGAELTVDHFQPRSRDGAHEWANWVYACFTCNNHEQLQLNRLPLIAHRLSRRREGQLIQALEESLRQQEERCRRVAALEQAVAKAERRLSSP